MRDAPQVTIDPSLKRLLPGLQVHLACFRGDRIGLAHFGLEPLRRGIFQKMRSRLSEFERLTDIPEVGAFMEVLTALGRDPARQMPIHARLLEGFASRAPFPVVNDAVDAVNLTGLYYRIPAWSVDWSRLHPPLAVVPAVEHQALVTIDGTHPAVGEPFLSDARGPLVGLQTEQVRGSVNQSTSAFVVALLDPGLEGGLDHDRLIRRLENWMRTLTGASMVGSRLAD